MPHPHREWHRSDRIGWLRAAVLGANDGVISTASLLVGVAVAGANDAAVLTAGIAGLAAGAMSMAAGEYVSVQSQADTEHADIQKERRELEQQPELELAELTAIYHHRGLDRETAARVAHQLMQKDALGAHVRDELGITETLRARPVQAAMASAASFALGAVIPILATLLAPQGRIVPIIIGTTLVALLALGALAAYAGGSAIAKGAVRVAFWGALAMGATAVVGRVFGAVA